MSSAVPKDYNTAREEPQTSGTGPETDRQPQKIISLPQKADESSGQNPTLIPYGRQDINQADVDAVVEVLRSDFLTQGPVVARFEQAVADYCQASHAVAVNSATSALHIACLALGVGQGDSVWTTPVTFVASANCAVYCGAKVDFVDIDPQTFNLSVEALEIKLREAKNRNSLPKVVIPVHMAGRACDMRGIRRLADEYGFSIIEDASHAIGARYQNEPVGNCLYSDITVFSFHPVKIITTAEGGMALTNDSRLAARMDLLRSHGVTRDERLMTEASEGPWYYQQIELGFNYRMTDIQGALGLSQLQRLDEFVAVRQRIAASYARLLADLPLQLPSPQLDGYSAFHLYIVRLQTDKISLDHRQVFEALRDRGIGVNLHYIPVYLQPFYRQRGFTPGYCPEAEKYYSEAISLPMYPTLSTEQQTSVCDALREVLGQ
ncbi:MAG: UDP-4-amino-4,6-dideoxy-N-acetyl-beta-L-altrosamine transaminase [Gammaproteobacteria bacterium]|nr:UDP-4-amino-4,6-dideoxy-N-acetyl-beta-L-altrosamine transaminase [Gammaproteobacteria bacterium]